MPFERTDAGLYVQTFQEIRDELAAAAIAPVTGIDPDLDTSDDSLIGRLLAILADREESLQQQIAAVDQDAGIDATGQALTDLALLTGTIRDQGSHSEVTLSMVVTGLVPAGSRVSDVSGSTIFETLSDISVSGNVQARALDLGPVVAPPGTLTKRVSVGTGGSLSSWTSVTNPTAAVLGTARETDPELRTRRLIELKRAAAGTPDAIRASVSFVDGVLDVRVRNDTALRVYEVILYGPSADSDEVAQAIWDEAPAGILAVSTGGTPDSGTATDEVGDEHPVAFSRAAVLPVYVHVAVDTDEDYPGDGDTQIVSAITAAFGTITGGLGEDVIQSRLYAAVYSVTGVTDVTDIFLGLTPGPTLSDNITVSLYQVAQVGGVTVDS